LDAGPVTLSGDDAGPWLSGNGPLPLAWFETEVAPTISVLPGQPARIVVDGRSPVGGQEISVSVRVMEAAEGGYDLSMTASVLNTRDAVGEVLAEIGLVRPGGGMGRWLLRDGEVGVARVRHQGSTYWFVVRATPVPLATPAQPESATSDGAGERAPANAESE
jgi:hypothetical protein